MIFRFRDTKLPFKKRLRDSLSKIYGMGLQRSSYICDLLGFGLSYNINYLNRYFFESLSILMKYDYILDYRLRNLIKQRLEYFLEIRLSKGLRIFKGLPIRGQRTHSNSSTPKRLKPIIPKKLESLISVKKVNNKKIEKTIKTTKKK